MRFVFTIFILNITMVTATHALPSTESVQGMINLCAAGRSIEVKANLNASLQKWLSGATAKGNAKISDIGAIIKLTEDDKIRVEALSVYHSCLKDLIPIFMAADAASHKTTEPTGGNNSFTINGHGNVVEGVHVGDINK